MIYKKNQQMEDLSTTEATDKKRLCLSRTSSNLIKKKSSDDSLETTHSNLLSGYIGPLSLKDRMDKVLRHL